MTSLLNYARKVRKINIYKEEKLDIVYTYVDYNDPAFRRIISKYKPEKNIELTRYEQFGEIYYSLKTLEKFAKNFVNNIYLVTFNQKIDDTKISDWARRKIIYISHSEIIPRQFLPTFNSIVIESFLFRIPGLTENFIYLNDDLFFGNYLKREILFTPFDAPIIYIKQMDVPLEKRPETPWLYYYENAKDLFEKKYRVYPNLKPAHMPIMMNKKLSLKVWKEFGKDLLPTLSKFREMKNINFWFLCYLVGLYDGYFAYKFPTDKINVYLNCNLDTKENVQSVIKYLTAIFKHKPYFFNINNINKKCLPIWNFVRNKYLLMFNKNKN